jgi:hydroxyacylglutathione hydrolase
LEALAEAARRVKILVEKGPWTSEAGESGRTMTKDSDVRIITRVVGPIETNCYILSCPETKKAVIVDPGGDADVIEAAVEDARVEPVLVVSTHGHSDHIASAAEIQKRYGIPFALHGDDVPIVKLSVKEAPFWGMGTIREPSIDRILSAGDEISFGGARGAVRHTPGHTPGGISIVFGAFVLVGDTLFQRSIGRTDFTGGNLDTLLDSIRRELFTLPDETIVYCGHGPRTTIGEEKRENPFLA